MKKTIEENWIDWESNVFGYGYGTGEPYIITELKRFLEECHPIGRYDYESLEAKVTPVVAWLFIGILCRANIIEYGVSPRVGWLSESGKRLREFVMSRSADELVYLARGYSDDYIHCDPKHCNCGPQGYQEGVLCDNPFWR